MGAWLDLGHVKDYVHGGESDSGYATEVPCPKCKDRHLVTLSRIGWFLYECRGAVVSGQVTDWRRCAAMSKERGDN